MMTLGRSGDERLAERFARGAGGRAAGGRASRSTTRRCSTSTPIRGIPSSAIARWPNAPRTSRASARAIIRTLQGAGIAACGKHFPGHGDTSTDSHLELPLVEHPPDRLDAVELVPFKAAIEADVAVDHDGAHPDPGARRGAARRRCRRAIVDGLLKKKLGLQGLVLTRRPRDEGDQRDATARPRRRWRRSRPAATPCCCAAGDQDAQIAALEAVIHAVEDGHAAAEARRGRAGAPPAREGAVPRAAAAAAR